MKATDQKRMLRFCLLVLGIGFTSTVSAQQPSLRGMLDENEERREAIRQELVPEPVNGSFRLPPLYAPSTEVTAEADRDLPPDFREDEVSPLQPLPESGSQRATDWNWSVVEWAAPNTFSNPRYFEDRMLERHGLQHHCTHLQPLASGARFFLTIPMLPYLMTISEGCECEYTLGYYRPGSCTPAFCQRPPYDRRAMVMEALSISGVMIAFP
jgi:hypothetical protein